MIETFVDRQRELETLNRVAKSLKLGDKINVAIIGMRRIGKTELLMKFKEGSKEMTPYLNMQRVGSPESFILAYLRELVFEAARKKGLVKSKTEVVDWSDILIVAAKLGVDAEVKKIQDAKSLAILFELQEPILVRLDEYCVYLLDEFQEATDIDKNFLNIMRSTVEKQRRICYIAAGSAITAMEKIFSDGEQPFFGQFRRMYLGGLSKEDTKALVKTILKPHGIAIDDVGAGLVYKLTSGHPFYGLAICRRCIEEMYGRVSGKELYYVFLDEVLSEKGDIYLLMDYVFNESLSRAYKGKWHRQMLLTLAEEEGLILSEVARRVNKPSGEVANYLKFLLRSDLIVRQDDRYYFRDPLLRFWLAKTYLGIDTRELKKERILEIIIKELEEKYLKAKTELGKAKEFELKYRFEDKFGLELENYEKEVELDLVGEKEGTTYIFEIKWRNREAGYRDIEKFIEKVEISKFASKDKKLFFVSRGGFTTEAGGLAREKNVEMIEDV